MNISPFSCVRGGRCSRKLPEDPFGFFLNTCHIQLVGELRERSAALLRTALRSLDFCRGSPISQGRAPESSRISKSVKNAWLSLTPTLKYVNYYEFLKRRTQYGFSQQDTQRLLGINSTRKEMPAGGQGTLAGALSSPSSCDHTRLTGGRRCVCPAGG